MLTVPHAILQPRGGKAPGAHFDGANCDFCLKTREKSPPRQRPLQPWRQSLVALLSTQDCTPAPASERGIGEKIEV